MNASPVLESKTVEKLSEINEWLTEQTLRMTKPKYSWIQHMDYTFDYVKRFLEDYPADQSLSIETYADFDPWLLSVYDKAKSINQDLFVPEKIRNEIYEFYSDLYDKMMEIQMQTNVHFMEYIADIKLRDYEIPSLGGYYWTFMMELNAKAQASSEDLENWIQKMLNSIQQYLKDNHHE